MGSLDAVEFLDRFVTRAFLPSDTWMASKCNSALDMDAVRCFEPFTDPSGSPAGILGANLTADDQYGFRSP